ncbi:MAG: ribosome-associated translation inhibitor RaiA [candidate division NC10 bacterium]|nr:ribosome-associated translation inhibitor RaiA [candidate division NC10 bacterium]
MQIHITARNLEITDALRSYAREKVSRMRRYLNNIAAAHVVLSLEKHRQIAEVTLRVRDLTIRGEEATGDLYSSIDLVMDKIERQILRYKEKIVGHSGRQGERTQAAVGLAREGLKEEPRIVKTKRFGIKPQDLDEAVMQMDLLGHNFYVFRNSQTREVNVLYRRRDGNYGLIEPTA